MATFPAAQGFDLGSILQAAQLGRSLNPEVMQQQALGNQIALQLAQIKLQDALDPNRPLSRQLNAALATQSVDPASLYRAAEITPTGESLAGITVQNTGALTPQQETLLQARDIASEQAGLPLEIPRALANPAFNVLPVINPFTNQPTNFVTDPNKAFAGSQLESDLSRIINAPKNEAAIALAQARSRAGTPKLYRNPTTGETRYFNPGEEPDEFQAYIRPGSAGGSGGLTENAKQRIFTEYADLTGISPSKILDDFNSGILTADKMSVTVGSLKGARGIDASEIKNYAALESLESDFNRVERGIDEIEAQFGPIQGRWNEFIARYPVAEQDPRVAEVFAEINSLAADQIHDKYGGALTAPETKRANKWALDTSLPVQTIRARIKAAKSGIASSKGAFEKTLKARNIRAPELFGGSQPTSTTPVQEGMTRVVSPTGKVGLIPSSNIDKALESGYKRAP